MNQTLLSKLSGRDQQNCYKSDTSDFINNRSCSCKLPGNSKTGRVLTLGISDHELEY